MSGEPKTLTLEEARRRHDAAREELSRLCHGGRFHMSIPAQSDDSDVILGDALRALKALTEGHDLVPRDDTAELVEAAERYLRAIDTAKQRRYERLLATTTAEAQAARDAQGVASREAQGARKALESALARVKGGER